MSTVLEPTPSASTFSQQGRFITMKSPLGDGQLLPLGGAAKQMLTTELTTPQFVSRLVTSGEHQDALFVIASLLPTRQALGWACSCLRTCGHADSGAEHAAIQAVERWTADPNDETRRDAWTAAEASGFDKPAGMLAAAICWGEDVGHAEGHRVQRAIATALVLAAVCGEANQATGRLIQFIEDAHAVVADQTLESAHDLA